MKKLLSLITLTGFLLATSLSSPPLLYAQMTKGKVKAGAKKATEGGKIKWESLTPEEQQNVKAQWKEGAEASKAKWESMSIKQQQELKEKTKAGAIKLKKGYQALPE